MIASLISFAWKSSLFAVAAVHLRMNLIDAPNRFPNTNQEGLREPKEANMIAEEVSITTSDNIKLHGWFVKTQHSDVDPTVVYFHENAGNIGGRIPFMRYFQGYCTVNILLVAYRGYSYSDGTPSEQGLQKDAIATIEYIFNRTDIDLKRVFIFGRSLGGAVGIYGLVNSPHPIAGIILENTFTSISDMVDIVFSRVARLKPLVLRNFWPSIDRISDVKVPILFILGLKDELIPTHQMLRLYQAAQNAPFKEKYDVPTGGHNDTWVRDVNQYFGQIRHFIGRCILPPKS